MLIKFEADIIKLIHWQGTKVCSTRSTTAGEDLFSSGLKSKGPRCGQFSTGFFTA